MSQNFAPRPRATLRARRIGFVFQAFNLLPRLSVAQNILLPLSYGRGSRAEIHPPHGHEPAARACWNAVGMSDRADAQAPNELSPAASANGSPSPAHLINEPKLILADEPTGNLDTARAASIMDLFAELNRQWPDRGRSSPTTPEDRKDRCKRAIRVRDGKIV